MLTIYHSSFKASLLPLIFGYLFVTHSITADTSGQNLEDYATQRMEEHKVVGASIAIIKNGQINRVTHLGFESNTTKVPVNQESLFQVGSISKPVAAWVAMTLVRDGKIGLDEPVNKHLKRWHIPASKFSTEQVTLRRLLSHTAGLRLRAYSGFRQGLMLPTLEESLSGDTNGAGSVELFQEPNAGFSYSGGGYTLIQLLIEEVSGMSFNNYAQHAVLKPLGMTDSSYAPDSQLLKHRIEPHGFSRKPVSHHEFRAQAAASLHTTAADLAKFAIANMSKNSILDTDMLKMMHSPITSAGFADVGLGFFVSKDGQLAGHGGSNLGWRAELQFGPQTQDGLVVLTNSESSIGFLDDLKCHWDAQRTKPTLLKRCAEEKAHATEATVLANRLIVLIAILLSTSIIVLIGALITSKAKLALPRPWPKTAMLLALASLTLFTGLFLYTPLGIKLLTGFNSIFATIHYAPILISKLGPWVIGVLLAMWLPFFMRRTNNV